MTPKPRVQRRARLSVDISGHRPYKGHKCASQVAHNDTEATLKNRALKKVAVRLNRGAIRGSSARLAKVMGVSIPTVRAWMSDPDTNENYRGMTRGSRRLLAAMVLLDGAGLLDDKFIGAVDTFDRLLKEGDARLDQAIQALGTVTGDQVSDDGEDE